MKKKKPQIEVSRRDGRTLHDGWRWRACVTLFLFEPARRGRTPHEALRLLESELEYLWDWFDERMNAIFAAIPAKLAELAKAEGKEKVTDA